MKIGFIQQTTLKRDGGKIYEQQVREVLSKDFDLELINLSPRYLEYIRYLKIPGLFFNLLKLKGKKDLWIRDFFSTITLPFDKTKGKNIVIVLHIDFSALPLITRPFFFVFEKIFYSNCKKVDAIVTISEYWKNYFLQLGYKNVYKIYNSFDLSDFHVSYQEILEFKQKYKLEGKPIIYIGNCQKAKGVIEVYQTLRDLDCYLITSGEPTVKIPAINLNLEYTDYLKLLKASSIVITMSKFKEGWCRTAHEAMLLKTPVIGSGLGGMKELLEGGNQIICKNFEHLREKVEHLLGHRELREKMGADGFNFTKNFTLERFKKEWIWLIKKLI